jgi:hypothetical protein
MNTLLHYFVVGLFVVTSAPAADTVERFLHLIGFSHLFAPDLIG